MAISVEPMVLTGIAMVKKEPMSEFDIGSHVTIGPVPQGQGSMGARGGLVGEVSLRQDASTKDASVVVEEMEQDEDEELPTDDAEWVNQQQKEQQM